MSTRPKRSQSSAQPGEIVDASKQKRRSPKEKAASNLFDKQAKIVKEKKHQAGVQCVVQKEDALRAEDELSRKNSACPDLVTAELKLKMFQQKASRIFRDMNISMDPGSDHENQGLDAMDKDGEGGAYQPGDENSDDNAADDVSDEEEAVQEFLKRQALEKKKASKALKAAKGAIRTEINDAAGVTHNESSTLKRKLSAQTTEIEPKKSKTAALGGLKKGWQKAVEIATKAPKTSTSVPASVPTFMPRGRTMSVSTNSSMPPLRSVSHSMMSSARSSVLSLPTGEFDEEESAASLAAAHGLKTMGILLVAKDVELSVDGKVKREPKPKVTNTYLPFPRNSYANDLKFWQNGFIPEFIDWIVTKEDPFAVNADPEFHTVINDLWNQHFGAYEITDAVYAQAVAAVRNWHSKFGKTALKAVDTLLASDDFSTVESCADHVRDKLLDSNFIYENKEDEACTRAYRSELMLRVFAAHLQVALKTDVSYGHPVGAMTISCAARLLFRRRQRKGKRSAHSFVAVPWAARAKAYLPGIKKLSTKKWSKIMAMSKPYIDSAVQVTLDDTDADESRTLVVSFTSRMILMLRLNRIWNPIAFSPQLYILKMLP
ncbi:hypothetical protein B0H10DRAFT_2323070 [Mycena sp. CBHHK59/15]|nr:hypothetical protein B0H10DRAFT_2323070 [Mycena sp. CBHHK59/15]